MSFPLTWTRRRFGQGLVSLAGAGLGPAWALANGDAAPDISLPGLQQPVKLSDWRGKAVYVDFWASWCGPCRKSFPWMNDLQARLGSRGLVVLGINLDAKRADADGFLATVPAKFTLAFDPTGDSARRYGIKGMPSSVLVGPDGRIRLQHAGFKDEDRAELEKAITAALPA